MYLQISKTLKLRIEIGECLTGAANGGVYFLLLTIFFKFLPLIRVHIFGTWYRFCEQQSEWNFFTIVSIYYYPSYLVVTLVSLWILFILTVCSDLKGQFNLNFKKASMQDDNENFHLVNAACMFNVIVVFQPSFSPIWWIKAARDRS